MLKVLSLSAVSLGLLFGGQAHSGADSVPTIALNSSDNAQSQTRSSFTHAPFIEALAQQIGAKASEHKTTQYTLGKISFKAIGQASNTSSNVYYIGSDGISSMLIKNADKNFSALLNYKGTSYQFNENSVTVLIDEFNKIAGHGNDGIGHNSSELQTQNSGFKTSFWESYQMSGTRSTQSGLTLDRNLATPDAKKVRVLVSENAIIEEHKNNGELHFSSLYERIQTGIDLANLALVTSGVESLQIETSEVVIQRLPLNYINEVVADDQFKRVAFPIWGKEDATFQLTAIALTQNKADIIYNLGASKHFYNNACGFATIGVNGKKLDTASYSTDHTYPVTINIKLGCETGRTPMHELGHTIGLNHERDNNGSKIVAGTSLPYTHNFGYTSLDAPAYSIMSYGLSCKEAAPSVSCMRSNFFSSPKLTYGNASFGVSKPDPDAADAVRFLNDTSALRFSNNIHPMSIRPEQSSGFTISWDKSNSNAQSQILVLSIAGNLRNNYVLDNHAVNKQQKIEIPLLANQTSYTFNAQQIADLDLHKTVYDTVSIFTGHINKYDDIIPHLHAQLHAGESLFTNANATQNTVIVIDGENLQAPQAGETLTFTFDASSIDNFRLDDLKIMTVLDSQYNAGFTTAVSKREYNATNPMLDFVDYELALNTQNKIELSLTLSSDYRDYAGFLKNRESSNYKLPIVGFYFEYSSKQDGEHKQTISQEVAIDLRKALNSVPFIQAESLAKVIDNDRTSPLIFTFSSTHEIPPSDVYTSIAGASAHQIGEVVTTWKQLPNKGHKYQYAVTLENPQAIDDEGDLYASVSFGLNSLNLFSTSMVIASNNLMFEHGNATSVTVSSQVEMPLSFSLTNLPLGSYSAQVSISKEHALDLNTMVDGTLSRVNAQQGILSFMFDPQALNRPDRIRINALVLEQDADHNKAHQWVDIYYNNAPQIVVNKTTYTARPGDIVTIPVPAINDADNYPHELIYSWQKAAGAPQFGAKDANIQITIASNAKENTIYEYTFEVSDGVDIATRAYTIEIEKAASTVGSQNSTINTTPENQPKSVEKSAGAINIMVFCLLFPIVWCRRFSR